MYISIHTPCKCIKLKYDIIIILLRVFAKERIVICLMFIYIYIYKLRMLEVNFLFAEFAYQMAAFNEVESTIW